MRWSKLRRAFIIVFTAALLLAVFVGCSGGETIEVKSEWEIVMEGLAFNRGTVAVPAAQEVVIRLKNTDTYTHNFAVYRQEGGQAAIAGPVEIPAHTIKEFSFTTPEQPGSYFYRDDEYPHKMTGVMIVSDESEVSLD